MTMVAWTELVCDNRECDHKVETSEFAYGPIREGGWYPVTLDQALNVMRVIDMVRSCRNGPVA